MSNKPDAPAPEKQTLASALQGVSEDDLAEATTQDEAEEVAEAEGEPELDAADDDDEEVSASGEDDADEANPFEDLTAEQLHAIKTNPETRALYKNLMRSYSQKTAARSEAIRAGQQAQQLAAALRNDP